MEINPNNIRVIDNIQKDIGITVAQPNYQDMVYFRTQVENQLSNLQTTNDKITAIHSNAYNAMYSEEALIAAREATLSMVDADVIRQHYDAVDLALATPVNQMYIMEHPTVRRMYSKGSIDGFKGTYFDPEPETDTPEERTLYQTVVSDLIGGTTDFCMENSDAVFNLGFDLEASSGLITELSDMEKHDILATWQTIEDNLDENFTKQL